MSGTHSLLHEYVQSGSEGAFRDLVSAYVDFVFSIAVRMTGGDRCLAEDVTQTVFTDLARKAPGLSKDVRLGGWLHRHTCFVARKALRRERRRIAREKHAVQLQSLEDYSEANLAQLGLVLDEAINDLSEPDRHAIVLRFFEQLDFRSIGRTLGSTEDAARMRVSRAIEKMATLLRRRGFVMTVSGVLFALNATLVSAAPTNLATRVSYTAIARGSSCLSFLRRPWVRRPVIGLAAAAAVIAVLALLLAAGPDKTVPDTSTTPLTPADLVENEPPPPAQPAPEPEAPSKKKPDATVPVQTDSVVIAGKPPQPSPSPAGGPMVVTVPARPAPVSPTPAAAASPANPVGRPVSFPPQPANFAGFNGTYVPAGQSVNLGIVGGTGTPQIAPPSVATKPEPAATRVIGNSGRQSWSAPTATAVQPATVSRNTANERIYRPPSQVPRPQRLLPNSRPKTDPRNQQP